ncbi:Pleckstrin homology (PH) domain superfamily protein [Zea mays]|jgi:hypothetical protein|uniref:Pleckstrin homology (PH) domain superfamily protein n=1 Tax=Zea mays TaxID=4577 RepID=A0A1D6E288_MAIZE|nr:Pleckstrin homology (PH) domain superfamily protein [Zea mays]ONM14771.1 Pleckstrin homology (PH) domain superfamily protein [Zea mays]
MIKVIKQFYWQHLITKIYKKLGQGGKDRPPDIILRRDRNMVPEKASEPWSSITNGLINCPLCNGPVGGWRAGYRSRERAGHSEDFFNQSQNSPLRGIESGTWRCYPEALTITLDG